jgi:hypothetical protein
MNTTTESSLSDTPAPALARQEGGNHYKDLPIQPVEYIHANGIGYFEGNVIKYVSRWKAKNGIDDLKKARHYLDLLIELESAKPNGPNIVATPVYSQAGYPYHAPVAPIASIR